MPTVIEQLLAPSRRSRRKVERDEPDPSPLIYSPRTHAGIRVDHTNAMTYATVYACTRVVAETLGILSWHHMARRADGGADRLPQSPIAQLLHTQPNPETDAVQFRTTMLGWAMTWGNGYAEIERDRQGRPWALWQIPPNRVRPTRDKQGALWYEILNPGQPNNYIPPENMYHLKGLGFDGLVGYSVIRHASQSIGLGMAAEWDASSFYANGSRPSVSLSVPGILSPKAHRRLQKAIDRSHRGVARAHRAIILEEGAEFKPYSINPDDAQSLESRKHQPIDICRFFGVPPHLVFHLEDAHYANAHEMEIGFHVHTICPWARRAEIEADIKLLGGRQRLSEYTKLNTNSILRGDIAKRYEAYKIGRQWGWESANSVLMLEDRNPIGPQGDVYLVPLNMVPADKVYEYYDAQLKQPAVGAEPKVDEGGADNDKKDAEMRARILRMGGAQRRIFLEAAERIVKREVHRASDAAKRLGSENGEFGEWLRTFYAQHESYIVKTLNAPVLTLAELAAGQPVGEDVVATLNLALISYALRHVEVSRSELLEAHKAGFVQEKCEAWNESRPKFIADYLIEQLTNAMVLFCALPGREHERIRGEWKPTAFSGVTDNAHPEA